MKSRLRFSIFAALVLAVTLAQLPSTVTSQQSKPPSVQKTPDQSQPSPEALERLRKLAAKQKTYQVGYNPAMERKLTQLSGIEIPRGTVRQALKVRQEAQQKLVESIRRREEYLKANPDKVFDSIDVYKLLRRDLQNSHPGQQIPDDLQGLIRLLPTFNWFEQNVSAVVKNQGSCNSCWAFAALVAYEYSYQIQQSRIRGSSGGFNQTLSDGTVIPGLSMVSAGHFSLIFSEQKMINCVGKDNSCGGGWHGSAFNHLVKYGAPFPDAEGNVIKRDYKGKDGTCTGLEVNKDFQALTWDYVNYPPDKIPTEMQLKTALLEHGPIVVLVRITEAFQAYQGGVFNEHAPGEINHAVVLIGWDDTKRAWLIQNSWGQDWGVKIKSKFGGEYGGYMWIAWDSNSIGKYAAWVDATIKYQ